MVAPLPLDQMTIDEKLAMIEQIWEDLAAHQEAIPVAAWHGEVLAERERAVAAGTAGFHDLDDSIRRIAARLK